MSRADESRLESLLRDIEETLVRSIPQLVGQIGVKEKVYALFIRYYDTSVGEDYTPYVSVAAERIRQTYATKYGEAIKEMIWRPQEIESDKAMPGIACEGPDIAKKCNECYRLMCKKNTSGLPMVDESELLLPFRSAMHRVAARLNRHDWTGTLDTTDDFAVVPTDEIGYWTPLDMAAGIPSERLDLLRSRGFV